jgi:plasmid stabilization system protein ParE
MTGIRFTAPAKLHLSEIWKYSSKHWGQHRADRYLRALNETVALVASGKRRARPCEEILPGLQFVRSGSHNIYLRWDREADEVQVIGVLHQAMEPSRHLRDE